LTETREALAQQTATAEVLQVINSSPGDLATVFDAMLEKAMELCGAAFGMLQGYDGEQFEAIALRGLPPTYAEFLRSKPPRSGPGTAPARIVSGEPVVHIADLKAEDAYLNGDPRRRAMVDLGGARSSIVVGLRKDEQLLGSISVYRQEVRPFTDKQIALLQNFAAQAVIAMENARLLTETREALEQQTATAEVLQVINSSPGDLAPVFDAMLEKATRLSEAGFGVLWTYDGECFHAAALCNVPPAYVEFLTGAPYQPEPEGAHGRIVNGESLIHIVDVSDTELYRSGDPLRRALVDLGGARSGIAVALRKDDALLGIFVIYRKEVRPC
jgi:GAF domain-containing protein